MHFSKLTAALALTGLSAASPLESRASEKGLQQAWTCLKGRDYIGTALTIRDDAAEQNIIKSPVDFNSVTPENAMKWESTEPTRNNFTFAGADAIVDFAQKYKKQIRCHTLVWHSQLPAWVSNGGFDNATLISIMENHIKNVAGRYKGKCTHWDVVNEALNEDGTYRESVWYNTIGEAYLPIAFRLAHKYDNKAKLYYNDYNIEYSGAKALGAQRILKLVKAYGAKIDGVGLQAHLTSEPTSSSGGGVTPDVATLERSLRLYSDLGADVAYTELDIRMTTPANATKLQAQADAYSRVTQACLNVKKCVGITLWGVSDKYSWIPGVFSTEGAALAWDENYQKKPAYYAMLNTIKAYAKNGGK
ncbi:hypothetical protein H2203_005117 [Taxawa tesnikishii (nom. ined.)]|nr:hypothetical protein H2203_005117 [Dothideales sp. JES 119]